ncbi:hypothetical protein ACJX0J_033971 [Zea mays]
MNKAEAILQHIETAQKDVWYIIARLEDAQKLGVWSEGRVVEAQDFFDMLFTEKCSGRMTLAENLDVWTFNIPVFSYGAPCRIEEGLLEEEEVPERSKRLLTRLISEDQFENMKSSWRSHKVTKIDEKNFSLEASTAYGANILASLDWLGNLLISCLVNSLQFHQLINLQAHASMKHIYETINIIMIYKIRILKHSWTTKGINLNKSKNTFIDDVNRINKQLAQIYIVSYMLETFRLNKKIYVHLKDNASIMYTNENKALATQN